PTFRRSQHSNFPCFQANGRVDRLSPPAAIADRFGTDSVRRRRTILQSVPPAGCAIRESPLTFFAVEENEVDVGAMIQFPAAKLAHAQNGEFSAGRARARAQACV